MAIGIGSPNASSLFALNALRVNQTRDQILQAQLSSGNRLTRASVDPSGLAISQGFRSMISGTDEAMYNAQTSSNMIQTADSTLSSQTEVLGRMRDLAVRASNDATLTQADRDRMNTEFQAYNSELDRSGRSSSYNGKQLTTDAAGGTPYGTQAAQVGPDNQASSAINVTVSQSTSATLGTNAQDLTSGTNARNAISALDTAIQNISTQRSNLGVTESRLNSTVNDLAVQRINLSGANSSIADMNMAEGVVASMRNKLLQNTGIAMLSATNAQAYGVLKLMGV